MHALALFKAAGQVGKEISVVGELLTCLCWVVGLGQRDGCGQVLFGYGLCSLPTAASVLSRRMPPVLSCCVALRLSLVWRLWSVSLLGVCLVWCWVVCLRCVCRRPSPPL